MSRSLRVPVSLAAAILLGLSSAAPSLAETAPAAPPSADATAIAVPDGFELAPDGTTLVHVASGLRFPEEFEGFTRLRERAFDPGCEYIAIGYDRPLGTGDDRIVVRMAVVHIDQMSPRDHYMIMRQATMSHFAAPTIVSEGPATIPTNRRLKAYRGTFTGYRDGKPWRSSLTTVDYGYWSGRMTAAYPESEAAEAEKYLGVLLAEIRAQRPKAPKR
ncbi:hypothetical protein [Sphingobium sp. DC-2]|uniref:hypothetical protein n=1 Tax=Sphingobium sp. DC-2 TaxID=1303256 RepID=UPI00068F6D07|nr:hypothetical protein [Sphingobium sp. DC-2]